MTFLPVFLVALALIAILPFWLERRRKPMDAAARRGGPMWLHDDDDDADRGGVDAATTSAPSHAACPQPCGKTLPCGHPCTASCAGSRPGSCWRRRAH